MTFELFDPKGDVRLTAGHLPHWYQPGVTYFVTFRTQDSLPVAVADLWYRKRRDWLDRNGINVDLADWKRKLAALPEAEQNEFHNALSQEFLNHLDKGYGECVLRRRELATVVADTLRHFNGDRYHLGDFIVMPNHVHLLVCLIGKTDIEKQCYSWKKFSATEINRRLRTSGRFWQPESFDHLVRSPEQFERFCRYIADNGKQAGLSPEDYLYGRYEGG